MIVTAHNEADRIGATLRALRDAFPDAELWVGDDASEDATSAVAAQAGARVVTAPERLGKGGAATLAAEALLRESDPIVVLADADLGESAGELRRLVDALGAEAAGTRDGGVTPRQTGDGCDLAIATFARRVGGGFGLAVGSARRAIATDDEPESGSVAGSDARRSPPHADPSRHALPVIS